MSFLRYMEFCKNETDTHPQTGETKKHTIVDVYVYPDSVLVWGWGWSNTFRPGEKSLDEIVTMVEAMFKEEHFEKTCDERKQLSLLPYLSHTRRTISFTRPEICQVYGQPLTIARLYQFSDRVEFRSQDEDKVVFRPGAGQTVDDVLWAQASALLEQGYKFIASTPVCNSMEDIQRLMGVLGCPIPQEPAFGENDEGWDR